MEGNDSWWWEKNHVNNNAFDAWEFPHVCVKCGHAGNGNKIEPISYVDAVTKLCESCYVDFEEEEEKCDSSSQT